MSKIALWRLPRDHFATLRNAATGKASLVDYLIQIGVPIAVGLTAGLLGFRMSDVDPAVAGVSIVSGLLFAVVVFLFQLRLGLPEDPQRTHGDVTLIDEAMFNVLWAILWGLFLVFYLVLCGVAGWIAPSLEPGGERSILAQIILSSVAMAATAHLLLVLAMCLKRIHRAYERVAMRRP